MEKKFNSNLSVAKKSFCPFSDVNYFKNAISLVKTFDLFAITKTSL